MILDDIVAAKRRDLAEEEARVPLAMLARQAADAPQPRGFAAALAQPGLSVIAEVKRASPSKGLIAADFDPVAVATDYERGGAAAISVLTERHYFQGSVEALRTVRQAVTLPILRKDFIVSERQIVEARAIGADAILLIAAILDDATMARFHRLASDLGLACLFEAHDGEEIRRVAGCGARVIGINNRNLKTMTTDLTTFEALHPLLPAGAVAVAESGIHSAADAHRMAQAGADAILVGESLMRAENRAALLGGFRGRGNG